MDKALVPYSPATPPEHTELRPRCFICKHFPVCQMRESYLKTAMLIEEILGKPNKSFVFNPLLFDIPNFCGTVIDNDIDYFPEEVSANRWEKGTFYMAKYCSKDEVNFLYQFEGYMVLFKAIYNKETSLFDIQKGHDIYYGTAATITNEDDLQLGLLSFREDMIERENQEAEEDKINTTYFRAELECDFYEWEKGLDYDDGVKRLLIQYPNGIPIGDEIYHLATYHYEKGKVPLYKPRVFSPIKYPCVNPAPQTRDWLNRD